MAEKDSHLDVYSHSVLKKLDRIHKDELPDELRSDIEKALVACQPKKHGVDVRGTLPFHFKRLYFVFLLGTDLRDDSVGSADLEHDYRQKTKFIAHLIYWLFALWPLYIIIAFVYFVLNNLPPLFTG